MICPAARMSSASSTRKVTRPDSITETSGYGCRCVVGLVPDQDQRDRQLVFVADELMRVLRVHQLIPVDEIGHASSGSGAAFFERNQRLVDAALTRLRC